MAGINHETLEALREKDGLSKTDFAKRLGISLTYYCDIERGTRKLKRSPGLIKKIAEELNVPLSALEDRRAS